MNLFMSFASVIRSRSYGYALSFQNRNTIKILYNKIHQPFQNRFLFHKACNLVPRQILVKGIEVSAAVAGKV